MSSKSENFAPLANAELRAKLKTLPSSPGVYFHKDKDGQIIYVGKAAVLKNRVRSYFQKSRLRDPKTESLISEIHDTDWLELDSEIDALFVEAELIRRYMPRYNILLRDDKSLVHVRINLKDEYPTVSVTRRPLDDQAVYIGPFLNAFQLKKALKFLRKVFPYSTHETLPSRGCLQYHIGLCPGPETGQLDSKNYHKALQNLIKYLKGQKVVIINDIEKKMHQASKRQDYELAARYRNQLRALQSFSQKVIFSDKEFLDLSKDHAISDLMEILSLTKVLHRIEGFDISHMSGTDNVASMVVFTNGLADKSAYRKFKLRIPGNDDFAHMNEAIMRRLSEKNVKAWGLPDLFLIDGGKGQLASAQTAMQHYNLDIPMVGIAKQYEQIVISKNFGKAQLNTEALTKMQATVTESDNFILVSIPHHSHVIKLIQRIRDESHRFAVSYHSVLKTKRQTVSALDDIPSIGPATRKKILKHFGSLQGLKNARQAEIEKLVGSKKATIIKQYLRLDKKIRYND